MMILLDQNFFSKVICTVSQSCEMAETTPNSNWHPLNQHIISLAYRKSCSFIKMGFFHLLDSLLYQCIIVYSIFWKQIPSNRIPEFFREGFKEFIKFSDFFQEEITLICLRLLLKLAFMSVPHVT